MTLRSAALVLALLLVCPLPSWGQAAPPHLLIDGVDVTRQAPFEVQNGALLMPAGVVARAFGATLAWDANAEVLTLRGVSGVVVRLTVGDMRAQTGSTSRLLAVAPFFRNGALWAPSLAVLRALGAYVVDGGGGEQALAQVTGVRWQPDGAGLAVQVSATGPLRVAPRLLHHPERLVLDLEGAITRLPDRTEDVGAGGVLRVRGGQFQVRPYVTRLVFDLDHAVKFAVATHPGIVALAIGTTAHMPPALSPPSPPRDAAGSAPGAPPAAAGPASGTSPSAGGSASAPPAASRLPASRASGAPGPASAPAPASAATPPPAPAQPSASATPRSAAKPLLTDTSNIAPEPLALPPLPEFADRPGAFHVQSVAYEDQGPAARITVRASQRVAYALHWFVFPDRLAIDIAGGVYRSRRHDIEVGSDAVRNIVISQFQLKPNLTRVLVHLQRRLPYHAALTDGGRTLVVMLGNPGRRLARGSAVILDPGHGGADSGAIGPTGLREADVALAIARYAQEALARQQIPAVLTRTGNTTVPLEERPDLAQRYGGIVFVSIHANASRGTAPAGTETYYETPASAPLARVIQSDVVQALGEPDRGVHTADFYVIVNTPMPAVLLEAAFISNPAEEGMLRDPAVQRRVGNAIARAVGKYLDAARQPAAP